MYPGFSGDSAAAGTARNREQPAAPKKGLRRVLQSFPSVPALLFFIHTFILIIPSTDPDMNAFILAGALAGLTLSVAAAPARRSASCIPYFGTQEVSIASSLTCKPFY